MSTNYEAGFGESDLALISRHATDQLELYLAHSRQAGDTRVLRDKQMDVMQDLRDFLATHPDDPYGYISLPTGVGKTVLFTELVKATGLRTIVLTPTKLLLGQTEETFNRFSDDEIVVGKVYSGEKNGSEDITLTTYASFVRHTKNKDSGLIVPGQQQLIILDEAHRALAPATRKALAQYKDAIQIGFTATEDYSEQRKLESLLPTRIHKMSIKEAVEDKLITPFVNIMVETDVDVSDVKVTTTNEYDAADLEKALNTEARNKIAVDMYLQYFKGMKAIVFCNGVAHAKAVAELFTTSGIRSIAVHGGMDASTQNLAKEAFLRHDGSSIDVLTNDKLLTEGFDAPEAAVCLNLSPTLSRVRAKQRGGRILRLDPNDPNKHAYIVDFIDQQYRKAPVLFSDPKVAEQARVGDQSNSIFKDEADDFAIEGAQLITDPQVVTDKAIEYYESHGTERRYAPEGWLSIGQISALYEIGKQTVRNDLDPLAAADSDKYGEFHNPQTKSRTTSYYFHPDLVYNFATARAKTCIDFKRTMPEDWSTTAELEVHYPPKVLKSMFYFVRLLHGGLVSEHTVSNRGTDYYSPALQKQLFRRSTPATMWMPTEPLQKRFNASEAQIEDACRVIARRDNTLDGLQPCWWIAENHQKMYLSPVAYKQVEELLRSQPEEGELVDGTEIQIQSEEEVTDLLFQFFTDEAPTSEEPAAPLVLAALRKAKKRQSELDAIYAAFND